MDKQDEKRIRQIAREEALKCIAEEDIKRSKRETEFMEKIQLPKEESDLS